MIGITPQIELSKIVTYKITLLLKEMSYSFDKYFYFKCLRSKIDFQIKSF